MSFEIKLPAVLRTVIERLEDCGFEAYAVGGFVRDSILGRRCCDFDVTTSALPSEIIACFNDYTVIETGLKHGTVTVVVEHTNIEVTTFRIDGEYTDNRRPEVVKFTRNLEDDLSRRDFTINALAYSESRGIVDLHSGIIHLAQCTISAIGDANTRFKEDALRILRAFRFCSQLGFSIDKDTQCAISEQAHLLGNISRERVTSEFVKILCADNASQILALMDELGVLRFVLPHYTLPQSLCTKPTFTVRLAQLIDSYDDTARLRFDSKTASELRTLLNFKHMDIKCERVLFKKTMRDIGSERFGKVLDLCCFGTQEYFELYHDIIRSGECFRIDMLEINGNDLVALGISGSDVGAMLNHLLELVISGECDNARHQLLNRATNDKPKINPC